MIRVFLLALPYCKNILLNLVFSIYNDTSVHIQAFKVVPSKIQLLFQNQKTS